MKLVWLLTQTKKPKQIREEGKAQRCLIETLRPLVCESVEAHLEGRQGDAGIRTPPSQATGLNTASGE